MLKRKFFAGAAATAIAASTLLVAGPAHAVDYVVPGGYWTLTSPVDTVTVGSTVTLTSTQYCPTGDYVPDFYDWAESQNSGILHNSLVPVVKLGPGLYQNKSTYTLNTPGAYRFETYGSMCGGGNYDADNFYKTHYFYIFVAPAPKVRPVPASGFKPGTAELTSVYKKQLASFAQANSDALLISCYPAIFAGTPSQDVALGHDRAVAACAYIKSLNSDVEVRYGNKVPTRWTMGWNN